MKKSKGLCRQRDVKTQDFELRENGNSQNQRESNRAGVRERIFEHVVKYVLYFDTKFNRASIAGFRRLDADFD